MKFSALACKYFYRVLSRFGSDLSRVFLAFEIREHCIHNTSARIFRIYAKIMKYPSVVDPDPEFGAFLAHGSGIREGKKSGPWIRDSQ
jgi:hypothetical protein